MAVCAYCEKEYRNYDSDAGTIYENCCSIKCATSLNKEIEAASVYLKDKMKNKIEDFILNWPKRRTK